MLENIKIMCKINIYKFKGTVYEYKYYRKNI